MPSSAMFTGANFSLQSITVQNSGNVLLVRFTNDPILSNPSNANDGLNLSNYSITGPVPTGISSISPVGGDPQSVYVYLGSQLVTGTYTLTVSNIQSIGGYALVSPTSGNFSFEQSTNERINAGSSNYTSEQIIRKHLSPGLAQYQPNWSALIEALSAGDDINFDNAKNAFKQLFLSSADGIYLDRRAADQGVLRPSSVGLIDELFRQLAIKLKNKKLVTQALLEVLEIFYGADATKASIISDIAEPYSIETGDLLKVKIDGSSEISIQFEQDDFALPTAATAEEVAASITRWLDLNGSKAYALPYFDPESNSTKVKIYSNSLGIRSSVEVTGGRAQNALRFPELLTQSQPSNTWAVTNPELSIFKFQITGATTTDLSLVQPGDYVNIFGDNFAANNRGTFEVLEVDFRYISGPTLQQHFTVLNTSGVVQGSVTILSSDDLMFYRPIKETINNGERAVLVVQPNPDAEVTVQLPVTTQAVTREPPYASYLKKNSDVTVTSLVRQPDGDALVTTGTAHGLSAGNQVWLKDFGPSSNLADINNQPANDKTDASLSDVFSDMPDLPPYARYNAEVVYIGEKPWFIGGSINSVGTPEGTPTEAIWTIETNYDSTLSDGSIRYDYAWEDLASVYNDFSTDVGAREYHTANFLSSSAVAVFGGRDSASPGYTALSTGAILPATTPGETWYSFALDQPVMLHQTTVLPNGNIYLSGGAQSEYYGINEIQGYAQDSYTSIIPVAISSTDLMNVRVQHKQVLLDNGKLLIIGGRSLSQSHVYNASTCLAHWKLDETSGAAVAVNSDNPGTYDLSVTGAPVALIGEMAKNSRDLSPSGSYLSGASDAGAVTALLGEWTVEFWTNNIATPAANHVFVSHGNAGETSADNILLEVGQNSSGYLFTRWENGAGVDVTITGTTTASAFASSINSDNRTWHHIAVVKKLNTPGFYDVKIYLDGLLYYSATSQANASGGGSGSWYVGRSAESATDLESAIDDIYISTVALTEVQILQNFIHGYGKVHEISGKIHNTVETYNYFSQEQSQAGSMVYARYAFEAVKLPNNQCLVIGGYGHRAGRLYHPTNNNIVAPVDVLELYDDATGRWYEVGRSRILEGGLAVPGNIKAFYFEQSNTVYIVGFTNITASLQCEMLVEKYDVATRKLSLVSRKAIYGTDTPIVGFAAATYKDLENYGDLIVITGGTDTTIDVPGTLETIDTSFLYVAGSGASSGGLNDKMFEVQSVPSATQFTIKSGDYQFYTSKNNSAATIHAVAQDASPSGQPGPYILDPDGLYSISNVATTIDMAISDGQHINLLQVAAGTASQFPDEPGWLVLDFGGGKQSLPVKYLGRSGPNNLILDYTFAFASDFSIGTSVILLERRGGFVPENPEELGMFYITNSTSGRIVASQIIDSIAAAGITLNKNIIYPSSIGLGAEFYPEMGSKLSDNVRVFAGDDVETEIARAQGELEAEEI